MLHAAECSHSHAPEFAGRSTDPVVCHCLHVTEMEIRGAVSTGAVETLRSVMECTGAGSGCTACHQRIRELLRERLSPQELIGQAPAFETTSAF